MSDKYPRPTPTPTRAMGGTTKPNEHPTPSNDQIVSDIAQIAEITMREMEKRKLYTFFALPIFEAAVQARFGQTTSRPIPARPPVTKNPVTI